MINTIFAKKKEMRGTYTQAGERVGSTVLEIPEMKIKDLRTKELNGYAAVRVEIKARKAKKVAVREIRTTEVFEPGQEVKFEEILKVGDKVNVTGISKGHGFAGVVKRHKFAGGPRTHGQSDRERAPGSSGSTTTPGRVFKGTKRAGHMGHETVTVKKLRVLEVDGQNRIVVLGGAVPGWPRNGELLTIKKL